VVEQIRHWAEGQADPSEGVLLAVAERPVPVQEQVRKVMEHTGLGLLVAAELVVRKDFQTAGVG
jgi:hypothetical protein